MIKKVVAGSGKVVAGSGRIVCRYRVVAEKVLNQLRNEKVVAVAAVAQEIHI